MKRNIRQLLTPENSLPLLANRVNGDIQPRPKKVQSTLQLTSSHEQSHTKTCLECGMTYYKYIKKDVELHDQHHKTYLNGVNWAFPKGDVLKERFLQLKPSEATKPKLVKRGKVIMKIIRIDKKLEGQIRRVKEALKIVNLELNASEGSNDWSKDSEDTNINANVFLALIENKIVGVCTTEAIVNHQQQARWMIYRTQTIVPNQVNRRVKLGISRIWVAPNWRRYGIGKDLLLVILDNSVYGVQLSRSDIAFSQPSTSGGLLAKSFNGVKHKSGEILLPVYLE